jgi:hypothetical protein
MTWTVLLHPELRKEVRSFDRGVVAKLTEMLSALQIDGPRLGRPYADTLEGSRHTNMKELRFSHEGVWRFAFAFDPDRRAVILVGGNKLGADQKRFYKALIRTADKRFDDWLAGDDK